MLLVLADDQLYPVLARPGGGTGNRGENGLWLSYRWYFGQHSAADVDALARRLRDAQCGFAYFHVRHVDRDGRLVYRYPAEAQRLTRTLRRLVPGVKLLAWVYDARQEGQVAASLMDAHARGQMVSEAAWLVRDCGFDGVQWDIETCGNGDPDQLSLLRETRAALPVGALVATCAFPWYPRPVRALHGWDARYFADVAAVCDQIAVMAYDTGATLPRLYVGLTRRNVVEVTRAVARGNPRCRVTIGLPTYGRAGRSHRAHAENLLLGLKGVREGLADPRTEASTFGGIALFNDETTTTDDWQTFRRWWRMP
ncbi:MAG: hypothetical protein HYU66_18940 [Armatimonadetes bacterium]|nr:hypothetical protein [Armatimonadota bacterium]